MRYAFFSAFIEQAKQENPEFVFKNDEDPATHIYSSQELIELFSTLCPTPIGNYFKLLAITYSLLRRSGILRRKDYSRIGWISKCG